ncbi:arginyl aa-tRNA synthetase protein 1 b [Aphelenchoides avenae]|nr:arginyl aa-tRNA synthetase protein 1 b [Aphelenchus avenae]
MTKHEQPEAAVVESYEDAFAKLKRMQKLLADMESGTLSADLLEELPELSAKASENEKLKYRVGILKRAIDEQRAKAGPSAGQADTSDSKKAKKGEPSSSNSNRPSKPATQKATPKETVKYVVVKDYGDSILEKLNQYFAQAVQDLFPEVKGDFPVKEASNAKFGDYQFDGSTQIARQLTALGQKSSPEQVAMKIIERLSAAGIDLIEKLEPAKVFVNVFLNKKYIGSHLSHVFLDGVSPPLVEPRRVVIDFSSPNIAKEMHVGHLRSTIIGESFSRLFEYVKFDVLRLNHIGDWGTQFGMLIAHLQDRFPNYLNETPPIGDLVEFYKESKKRFDEDEAFKKRAYECVVKLQNYDADIVKAWQDICDVSRKGKPQDSSLNQQIYDHLGVRLVERGESFYQSRMQDLVRELEQQGVLKEEEGRKLLFIDGHDIPLTVVKSDGGYTYDTSDLAALKQRLFEERGDWLIYVVDLGQALHLEKE